MYLSKLTELYNTGVNLNVCELKENHLGSYGMPGRNADGDKGIWVINVQHDLTGRGRGGDRC